MNRGKLSKPVNDSAELFGAAAFVETLDEDVDGEEEGDILSFDALKHAFAKINACEEELNEVLPFEAAEEAEVITAASSLEDDIAEAEFDICVRNAETQLSPRSVIEAILFTGNKENRPIPAEQIAEKMRNVSPEEIGSEVAALNEQYVRLQKPYCIISENGGYRMILRSEYDLVRKNFYGKERRVRLPQQAIDTLAVVAYKQPVTAEVVTKIRQEPSLPLLNQLVRRGLLRIEKAAEEKKTVSYYRTSKRFLELFQLETLADLPTLEDV
ncbi:MAG: SMC-Scp complex subunit ScpB [Planctomycetaceae bacterium]|jgi:segregation and condensation protein B|nr:SMC-Scp complex subunit ScpB [Planctomycetaceae bacterium]